MMTLANKITLMRAALSIVMFLFILLPYGWARITATLIFILAASTDWVDGKIAPKPTQSLHLARLWIRL